MTRPNEAVKRAIESHDYYKLSVLGKIGAQKKKDLKAFRLRRLLADVQEKLHEANEDVCPVDD